MAGRLHLFRMCQRGTYYRLLVVCCLIPAARHLVTLPITLYHHICSNERTKENETSPHETIRVLLSAESIYSVTLSLC